MVERENRRGAVRHSVSIPAMLVEDKMRVAGLVENLSTKGALVTNASERPEIGTVGTLRLTGLRASLRTSGLDELRLAAQVVRHDSAGFAVVFLGGQEPIRELLNQALAHRSLTFDEED